MCISICEFIIFDRTFLPFTTIDADVSSQLDSIPSTTISFFIFCTSFYIKIDTIFRTTQLIPANTPENIGESKLESKPVIQSIKNAI